MTLCFLPEDISFLGIAVASIPVLPASYSTREIGVPSEDGVDAERVNVVLARGMRVLRSRVARVQMALLLTANGGGCRTLLSSLLSSTRSSSRHQRLPRKASSPFTSALIDTFHMKHEHCS